MIMYPSLLCGVRFAFIAISKVGRQPRVCGNHWTKVSVQALFSGYILSKIHPTDKSSNICYKFELIASLHNELF